MYLVTSGLWDEVPRDEKLLLLGTWCLPDYGSQYHEFLSTHDYEMMASPWKDRTLLRKRFGECIKIAESLVHKLQGYLNAVHGVDFGVPYWRCLIELWLITYSQFAIDRYVHIKYALETYDGLETTLLDKSSFIIPDDSEHFISLYGSDIGYNLQIYSQALTFLEHQAVGVARLNPDQVLDGQNRVFGHSDELLAQAGVQPAIASKGMIAEMYCHPAVERLILRKLEENFDKFVKLPKAFLSVNQPVLSEARLGLAELGAESELERFLLYALPYHFPAIWLENYHIARATTLACYPNIPVMLVTHHAFACNESFKFLAGEVVERGGKYIIGQHGGGYGNSEMMAEEIHQQKTSSEYWVWGWADRGEDNLKDVASLKLSSAISLEHHFPPVGRTEKILFVSTSHPKYCYKLVGFPLAGEWSHDYLENQATLFEALPDGIRSEVLYRGYLSDHGHGIEQRMRERFPEIAFEDDWEMPLWIRMKEARLVLIDYIGTTYLEAMAFNVPTICTWDSSLFSVRVEALADLQLLEKAGIYHPTPEGAAVHLRKIDSDPQRWWMSEDVQAAKNTFLNNYGRVDPNWAREWPNELLSALGRSVQNYSSKQNEEMGKSS